MGVYISIAGGVRVYCLDSCSRFSEGALLDPTPL